MDFDRGCSWGDICGSLSQMVFQCSMLHGLFTCGMLIAKTIVILIICSAKMEQTVFGHGPVKYHGMAV
ncbi:hypothetical protein MANES_14G012605v8 [Manihot esculenta]|uniref:Uncharacterized protein n=4 Tax=Manihot esculenta TaxID=3983 RepID=A0ACB7GDR6_MANES|nr:hypothetical protein MANES_14G012605v8 [Manihot esculenta]KAG8638218.1 hypothetical protein MANES_14G012605v8 [Manihot esculenta]KAG8638219.1 hypothetical protein MANES_14G012605v8 [Manihot esculenta]KAG8638220.1 hypothetical protein MANES_14G012605v8 [Manihot esculenta]